MLAGDRITARPALLTLLLTGLALTGLGGCAPAGEPADARAGSEAASPAVTGAPAPAVSAAPAADASAALAVATEVGVPNARMPLSGVVTAGQPTREQLDALRGAGVTRFISLRPTSEAGAGWEEAHAAEAAYAFDRLPISGAESLTRENVERFAQLMEETEGEATVLYCASSNRVGALLALKAHWIDGIAPEEAMELGRAAGMTRLEGAVAELLGIEGGA